MGAPPRGYLGSTLDAAERRSGLTTFTPKRVFERDGFPIAEIESPVRTLYVHKERNGQLYHWDRPGLPVRDEELAGVAREMLSPKRKRDRKKPDGPYPERQCARCPDRFTPKGPQSYICPKCKSDSMKRIRKPVAVTRPPKYQVPA